MELKQTAYTEIDEVCETFLYRVPNETLQDWFEGDEVHNNNVTEDRSTDKQTTDMR